MLTQMKVICPESQRLNMAELNLNMFPVGSQPDTGLKGECSSYEILWWQVQQL